MLKGLNLKELSKYIRLGRIEIFAAAIFIALLLYPFPNGGDRFFWKYFFDAGHPILFFICTMFIHRVYAPENSKSKRRVILEAAIFSFLIACLIELIQPIFGRSASLEDITLGAFGIIPACFLLSPYPVIKVLGPLLLILVQSIAFVPATRAMDAIKWRKENFPLLANFEDLKQMPLMRGTFFVKKHKKNHYAKVYQPADADFLLRYEAGDKDWSKFKSFNAEILNPLKFETIIHLRIDDDQDCKEYGTRYSRGIGLSPGWNKVSIPLSEIADGPINRTLNLEKIRYVYFFINEGDQWFGIDNLSLNSSS